MQSQECPGRASAGGRVFLFAVAATISLSCATANQTPAGGSETITTPTPRTDVSAPHVNASPESKGPAGPNGPALSEVREAVARVCQDAVAIDASRAEPFVVGDFNGDGSEDLAVVVRPAKGALPKLNSEYANWIVEDPLETTSPAQDKPAVARVQQDDLLLLILHGYRRAGWRDKLARQTFLLRNVVGENIRVQPLSEAAGGAGGKGARSLVPRDAIRETLKGHDGFLYWANARYAWHQ